MIAYASVAAFLQKAFRRTLRFLQIDFVPSTTFASNQELIFRIEIINEVISVIKRGAPLLQVYCVSLASHVLFKVNLIHIQKYNHSICSCIVKTSFVSTPVFRVLNPSFYITYGKIGCQYESGYFNKIIE
ncbi:hypothetical protein SAMN06272722_103386 [Paenibacillus sp. RU5A]|nr:hypothetical protein SAMN06272722_103386 [Paenibacillus sp. RU5A]SOC69233.1 hypothetical protein SAMN05880581_103386 [Paenibacillus sp. RU26A]SOC71678.1 hypothetical protein SAMN05880586_103386 [Paenibacillus sp. RU5M]